MKQVLKSRTFYNPLFHAIYDNFVCIIVRNFVTCVVSKRHETLYIIRDVSYYILIAFVYPGFFKSLFSIQHYIGNLLVNIDTF